jgi:hypothetical protein
VKRINTNLDSKKKTKIEKKFSTHRLVCISPAVANVNGDRGRTDMRRGVAQRAVRRKIGKSKKRKEGMQRELKRVLTVLPCGLDRRGESHDRSSLLCFPSPP